MITKRTFYLCVLCAFLATGAATGLQVSARTVHRENKSEKRRYQLRRHWQEISSITLFTFLGSGFIYTILAKKQAFGLTLQTKHGIIIALACALIACMISYFAYVEIPAKRIKVSKVSKDPLNKPLVDVAKEDPSVLTDDLVSKLNKRGIYKVKDLAEMSVFELKKRRLFSKQRQKV